MLPPVKYIKTDAALRKLVMSLEDEPLIAFDTESNSMHAYQERVCLIQMSTRTQDYIIDPLMINQSEPLGRLFESPRIEVIFHAAEYDLMCLKRDFGFTFRNLFDTMLAARICGLEAVGLGSMLAEYANVRLDKSHQRDNWGKRPLPKSSVRYAQMDTHYLPMLRDMLYDKLDANGRLDEAHELFTELCDLPAAEPRLFDEHEFWNIGRPNRLKRAQLKILREVVSERDAIARQRDRPPYKVMTNDVLIALARQAPRNVPELKRIKGFSARQVRRYGKRMLKAVARGKQTEDLPPPPPRQSADPLIADRYAILHNWRKERARERGVESDIIISKHTLWNIAQHAPKQVDDLRQIRGIGPWRLDTYGEEILHVLNDHIQKMEKA
jgi:ribonuclease D